MPLSKFCTFRGVCYAPQTMSNEPSADTPNLDIDLAQSFLPAWAKESGPSPKLARLTERFGNEDRPPRGDRRPDDRRPRSNRPPSRGPGGSDRRDDRRSGPRREDRFRGRRDERPRETARLEPVLTGWDVRVLPEPRGVEGLAKQIRTTMKAYPLFELAMLVLEKPERYLLEFKRTTAAAPALFQLTTDGSLWATQAEAVTHAVSRLLDTFYRRESVTVEPPKGNYACVAQCGMSDVWLGPPNHHDYSEKVRKLHAARFSRIPFEEYKSRIRMVKDEESIQKWKDEQSVKDEFYPLETIEGGEPVKLANLAEVERHFRENYATAIVPVENSVTVSGRVLQAAGSTQIRSLGRRAVEELKRFPLNLAHVVGQELSAKGIQIFKAHENITYVSIARPRYLDRQASPVAEGLSGILDYLEGHAKTPRAEQWNSLLELRAIPAGGTEADREPAVLRDLSLLLHEGYVIDYARRGLEAVRRPKPRTEKPATPQGMA